MPLTATQNILQNEGYPFVKMINFILPAITFALTSIGLQIDWHYIALAVGGSFSGSVLLGYFRREKSKYEQIYKVVTSAIGGLIVGSALVTYRRMEEPAYIALAFFICSMLVLIILRTFLSLTETNAATLTTTLIQRVFNIKLDSASEKAPARSRGGRKAQTHSEVLEHLDAPQSIIERREPDEIKIIEQKVIANKE
jgi:hypothetical protein